MNNENRYSPKENLGLLIIANENVEFKDFDNLIASLKEVIAQKKSRLEILESVDAELISQIENYWTLKETEVIAYGYLVFNHFKISQEEITSENITRTFIYQMRFYSPENAVMFVERNFKVELEDKNNE